MYELSKRRMALYKHARIKRDVEAPTQVCDPFGLALTAAIGKKYKWYTLFLEIFESLMGSRKRIGGAEQYAINAVGQSVPRVLNDV